MFCENCGNKLPDVAKFCGGCGAKTEPVQPAYTAAEEPAPARPIPPPAYASSVRAEPSYQQAYTPQQPSAYSGRGGSDPLRVGQYVGMLLLMCVPILSINAKALSPEAKKLQDRWQMLFLGKKDGDSFAGNLYLSRIEEKVGAYPGVASLTGNCSVYETPLQLHFLPFDEAAYRKAGGHMGSMQTSSLSHMAAVNCEGNNLLFTAAGDTVFVELPGSSFGGVLEGKLTGSGGQTERVYEESLALCRAEYAYSTAPQPEGSDNWTEAARQGTQMTGITLTEDALNRIAGASGFATELEGQCLWLPNGFIPLTAPFDCYEQNVLTNPTFSYTEDGLWLDKIGPLYRQHFSGMRDFSVKEGEYGGHYSMEIVFSYGVKTIYIELCDGNAGTDVTVMMFGQ